MHGLILAGEFFQNIVEFLFLVGYAVLFVVSIIILRPFRVHKHRRYSTMAIKISYLIFLGFFLTFTYLLIILNKKTEKMDVTNDSFDSFFFNPYFLIFLSSTIIPNVGIMIRRRVKKKRLEYNIILTLVNLLYAMYLLYLIVTEKWMLM